ncbi:MAG: type I-C CRISPR-associated protein Cas8c/Csd1, partial [Oscillospiraceae bacterium]
MSWVETLSQTYDRNAGQIGVMPQVHWYKDGKKVFCPRPLLPLFHMVQNVDVEIVVDIKGNWVPHHARVLAQEERMTIIPCTEGSSARSGKAPQPHPLCDKLPYLAADYQTYGGEKAHQYVRYMEQLEAWCASPYGHPSVRAVCDYLKKGTLISDLVQDQIFFCGDDGMLLEKWNGERGTAPPIFNYKQKEACIRFCVQGAPEPRLFADKTAWNSFGDYQRSLSGAKSLCYATGEQAVPTQNAPKAVRRMGENEKLISANDTAGFTYRGRFATPEEASCISGEAVQKSHNALKWLIDKQGKRNGDQVILAWSTGDAPVPTPLADSFDLFASLTPPPADADKTPDTGSGYALRLSQAISGYHPKELEDNEGVMVLVLDSATPGRLSMPYYRELRGSEYLARIQAWHSSCAWLMRYRREEDQPISFEGAPALLDIVTAAYGSKADDKLKKIALERLLTCVVDGARLPSDLIASAVHRLANPLCMENWEREKAESITCALLRKDYNDRKGKEEWTVSGEKLGEQDRSELFGRVLAYYDHLERWELNVLKVDRPTNAMRYRARFVRTPAKTADLIEQRADPYLKRLGGKATVKINELNVLYSALEKIGGFTDVPLQANYLLGYRSQLDKFEQERLANKAAKEAVKTMSVAVATEKE